MPPFRFLSSRQISLRQLLILPFVLQIFGAVGLTSYLSLTNGRKAVNNLATKLEAETTARVEQHLDNYLALPAKLNHINADAIKFGFLKLDDLSDIGEYFWHQMQQFDVGYINYGSSQGDFVGVERLDDGELLINESSRRKNDKLLVYRVNEAGQRQLQESKKADDFTTEGWYAQTAKARQPIWSSIYKGLPRK
jgi:hypothetical protein